MNKYVKDALLQRTKKALELGKISVEKYNVMLLQCFDYEGYYNELDSNTGTRLFDVDTIHQDVKTFLLSL